MNPPLPRPPELHAVLPPALAAAVEKAQHVADARLAYLLEPGCPRDTFHHDIRALYTLVRINKTLTDYCLRHPTPTDRSSSDNGGRHGVAHGEAGPSAPSDYLPSVPVAYLSHQSHGSNTPFDSADSSSYRSHKPHRSHGPSSSVKSVKSVDGSASDPASPTNLLSPLLVRLLDRAELDLGHHMETHVLSRGLERPALFPADVERLAALVSVRVTLAEVAARAPNLPKGAFNAWLALALDAGALGKHPWDPETLAPRIKKILENEKHEVLAENEREHQQRQAARLVDDFLADVHQDPAPPADILTPNDSPASTCPSHSSHALPASASTPYPSHRSYGSHSFDPKVSAGPVGADLRVRPASDPTLGDDSEFRGRHGVANGEAGPAESVQSVDSAGHGEASQRSRVDDSSGFASEPVPASTARAAVDALLETAEKSFESLHRCAGRLAREPHNPPFFRCVPESAFALSVDRAEPLPAAPPPAPEPSLTDQIFLVKTQGGPSSPNHPAESPDNFPATHMSHRSHSSHSAPAASAFPVSLAASHPSHRSHTSHAPSRPPATSSTYPSYPSYTSCSSSAPADFPAPAAFTPPKSIRVAPALSAFPKDLKRHVLAAPVDAADLTSRASAAAGRWIFHTVTDALFLLLRHIDRSIGHPTRPPTPFSRPYLPPPWKPLPP